MHPGGPGCRKRSRGPGEESAEGLGTVVPEVEGCCVPDLSYQGFWILYEEHDRFGRDEVDQSTGRKTPGASLLPTKSTKNRPLAPKGSSERVPWLLRDVWVPSKIQPVPYKIHTFQRPFYGFGPTWAKGDLSLT